MVNRQFGLQIFASMVLGAMLIQGCSCNESPSVGSDAGTDAGLVGCQLTPCTGVGEVCDQYGTCVCGPGYVWDDFNVVCHIKAGTKPRSGPRRK